MISSQPWPLQRKRRRLSKEVEETLRRIFGVPMDPETQELIENAPDRAFSVAKRIPGSKAGIIVDDDEDFDSLMSVTAGREQWTVLPANTYAPCGKTVKGLPAGIYKGIQLPNIGLAIRKATVVTDTLIEMPDSASLQVLRDIQHFWKQKDRFKALGQLYKRGVMLFGPAGSGKTSTMILLGRDVVAMDGIVFIHSNRPSDTADALEMIRAVEPERPIVSIFEDIDEITKVFGDSELLSILDGERQISNVVNVATTNFPENLGARFLKRPGRFDEVIQIGMPSKEMRFAYIQSRVPEEDVRKIDVERWLKDTDGMSLAFMRELIVGVCCLDKPYDTIIAKLKIMAKKPKSVKEYESDKMGFDASRPT